MTTNLFDDNTLQQLARSLAGEYGDPSMGELHRVLTNCNLTPQPASSKEKCLHATFVAGQARYRSNQLILAFIKELLAPVRYSSRPQVHRDRLLAVNRVLLQVGLQLGDDNEFRKVTPAKTLDQVAERTRRLVTALESRGAHSEVLKFCSEELLAENYFHAVLEASKGVASRIRTMTGLTSEGSRLIDEALTGDRPLLLLNSYQNEIQRNEQKGYVNLLKGILGAFRGPSAHAPRIEWSLSEQDALDMMGAISLAHRRLDKARLCKAPASEP